MTLKIQKCDPYLIIFLMNKKYKKCNDLWGDKNKTKKISILKKKSCFVKVIKRV